LTADHDKPQNRQQDRTENRTDNKPIVCRGIRGATTVEENTAEAILAATREMLLVIIDTNGVKKEDVASVYFTTTSDVNAEYPALAARQLGWHEVALMCGHEMNVPHGLPKCIRVLVQWNTTRAQDEIHHVYIRGAVNLRPDRSIENSINQTSIEQASFTFETTNHQKEN
jgi:chorismate mutase